MKTLLLLFPILLFAQFAPRTQVENCINLSAGKLVVPSEAVVNVTPGCLNEAACVQLPANFSCITFGFVEKANTIKVDCTNEVVSQPEGTPTDPPENPSPTMPQCSPALCPAGYIYAQNPKDSFATCTQTTTVLELIPSKQAAYDAQKADAELAQTQWKEAQASGNIQQYCVYWYGMPCQTLPESTKQSVISKASYILGIPAADVTKMINHKVNKGSKK